MDNKQTQQMNAEMSSALFSERERFEMLFAENWKKIAVIGVAVALVVALAFAAWGMVNRSATKAAYAFADAADAPALEKALAENGSRKGALAARQRLIQLYVDAKNYPAALKQIKLVASDAEADSAVRGRAALNEALVLELSGKTKEAAAVFAKTAADINFKNAIRLEAAAAAARLLAPADANGAEAVLAKAAKLTADSQSAAQYLSVVKAMQLALENGELGPKTKAKAPKAK
jgi:hypothetical protein